MEEEEKKRSRWARSLSEAGLLDEIEDSWVLPEDKPVDGSTITVEGGDDRAPAAEEAPAREPSGREGASLGHGAAGLPQTPVERKQSSDPVPMRPTRGARPRARQTTRPSQIETPPKVRPAKQTMDGIPSAAPRPPAAPTPAKAPMIELEPVREVGDRALIELEPVDSEPPIEIDVEEAAVVDVRGARISVPPEPAIRIEDAQPEIIDRPPAVESHRSPRQLLTERYELGDYSGALQIAEDILRDDPDDVEAADYAESCREVLIQMYEARIGSFDRVPQVAISEHELIWRDLDPSAGFILSRIDGFSTFEDVIDISGMPRFETCRILGQLLQEGIIK